MSSWFIYCVKRCSIVKKQRYVRQNSFYRDWLSVRLFFHVIGTRLCGRLITGIQFEPSAIDSLQLDTTSNMQTLMVFLQCFTLFLTLMKSASYVFFLKEVQKFVIEKSIIGPRVVQFRL